MKRKLVVSLIAIVIASSAAAQESEFPDIKNFFRVSDQVCTGGQPSMENLKQMKERGVRAVINLRRASEFNAEEEAAMAKQLGLLYFHIPVDGGDIKDEQVAEFLKVTNDVKNRPAFIHCASANRVGAFWLIRRVLVDKWPFDEAEAEARKIGLRSDNLLKFATEYIQRARKQ